MRIYDIVSEKQEVDEAPAGMIGQGLKRVGAKLAGAVGMKGTAAGLTGKADTGKEANQLMVDLKGYLGRTGGNLKQLDAGNLSNFLQQKGYPTSGLQGVSGVMTPKQIDQALLKSVQLKAQSGAAQPAAGSQQGAQQPAAGQTQTTKSSGVVGKVKAAAGAVADKIKGTSAQPAATSIPPELAKKIQQLTPQQKQELAGMLQ
jgi:hypothetical protein